MNEAKDRSVSNNDDVVHVLDKHPQNAVYFVLIVYIREKESKHSRGWRGPRDESVRRDDAF
jgi:hypothetical protein